MSKLLPEGFDETLRTWVEAQPMFFVGTAPGATSSGDAAT